ncbi:MAG: hypothetical protein KGJ37_04150 [Verrucomicrobiota bacterium]|nr:hypothetical protein [Verrucomicrobiota bacterium]
MKASVALTGELMPGFASVARQRRAMPHFRDDPVPRFGMPFLAKRREPHCAADLGRPKNCLDDPQIGEGVHAGQRAHFSNL